jgi:energy-coupling factor transporter ATP-binding protein EcfA2
MDVSVHDLLDGRLVMVTGKGGTGKTTYAAALAVVGAAQGQRTVFCEIDTQRPSAAAIFGEPPPFEPVAITDKLHVCNIHWDGALVAYLTRMLPVRRLVKAVLDNQVVQRVLDAAPGTREVAFLSRIGQLVEEYDLVVVDMPASGHAFSMLDILRSALDLFQSGPVRKRAIELRELFGSEAARLVFVAIPEEMVVNETIETHARMEAAGMFGGSPTCFLNRATLPSLSDNERALLSRLWSEESLDGIGREYVRAGLWEDRLEQATAASSDRLAEVFGEPPVMVPPAAAGGIPRQAVAGVAVHLARQVGIARRDLPWI